MIADVFADESSGQMRIEHDISFQRVAGLPARIHATIVGLDVSWMRIIGTVDDRLLVLPLRRTAPGEFDGEIPTPEQQLRYSFQFGSSPEKALLSPVFIRKQRCSAIPAPVASADKRSRMIEEAVRLDMESDQLIFAQRTLQRFAAEEQE